MPRLFKGSEIVGLGVQIEKNGAAFYNAVAAKAKEEKAQKIFQFLEGEEKKHIQSFQKLSDTLEAYEPAESYPGEYHAYVRSLADGYVFAKSGTGAREATLANTDEEALTAALDFEKESILLYTEMKNFVSEHDGKVVDELLRQEKEHIRQLSEVKQSLSGSNQ